MPGRVRGCGPCMAGERVVGLRDDQRRDPGRAARRGRRPPRAVLPVAPARSTGRAAQGYGTATSTRSSPISPGVPARTSVDERGQGPGSPQPFYERYGFVATGDFIGHERSSASTCATGPVTAARGRWRSGSPARRRPPPRSARGSSVARWSGAPRRACARPAAGRRTAPRTGRAPSTRRCGSPTSMPIRCCGAATCSQRSTRGHVDVPRLRRGQRRAPGPRRHHEVAAPPQHRAQRRPQRRRRPAGARARLAARDLAAGCCRGRSTWRPGPTTWRRAPTARFRSSARAADLAAYDARAARRPRHHGRPPRDRGRPRARRRPGERRGRRRRRLPDDVAEPLLRQRLRRLGARRRQGRPDRRRPRDGRADGGARDAGRRRPRLGGRRSTTSWRWPPGRSSPRTPGVRGVADNSRNLTDAHAPGHRRDRRPARHRVLADRLRRRRRGGDRPLDPLRGRRRRRRARRARLGLRRRGPGAVRRDRAGRSSPTRCSTPASPTTRSRRSWAATPGGCWRTSSRA